MTKRFFLDTEFIEDGRTIELISIGLVCEDGREYYAISKEFNPHKTNDWVWENVLRQIGFSKIKHGIQYPDNQKELGFRDKATIKEDVLCFLSDEAVGTSTKIATKTAEQCYAELEFWADYCSYDWVVLCQLFGTMMDLPAGFPMYCNDIQQLWVAKGRPELPKQKSGQHNALEDARYNKLVWEILQKI